jgi:ADP-ribose pyrophosphatase YjhB (NUDIX family)
VIKILYGERIGRQGKIRLGCAAVLFDNERKKVLLTRRADNGQWCLPSGGVEAGESVSEACQRETWEETGLRIQVGQLLSVHSSPDRLVAYSENDRFQIVSLAFAAEIVSGDPGLSDETTAIGFYSLAEIETMDILSHHRQFIADALAGQDAAFIR